MAAKRGVMVPGAFNALSAKVIADLGFEAIYVTGADILFVVAVTTAEEIRALPQRLATPQLMNMVIGIVLYANAALQGALLGMQTALTVLRDEKEIKESSGLISPWP